jgi:hypothetical protein
MPGGAVDAGGGSVGSGQTQSGQLVSGEFHMYKMSLNPSDSYILTLAVTSGTLTPYIRIYDPVGALVNSPSGVGGGVRDMRQVTQGGVYTVVVIDFSGSGSGSYDLGLGVIQGAIDPGGGSIASGQTISGSLLREEFHTYRFNLKSSDSYILTLAITSGTLTPYIRIYDPFGNLVSSPSGVAGVVRDMRRVSLSGTYTVVVIDFSGTGAGDYALRLGVIPGAVDSGGGSIGNEQTVSGSILPGQFHLYTLNLNRLDSYIVTLSVISGTLTPYMRIYDPLGNLLSSPTGVSGVVRDSRQVSLTGVYTIVAIDFSNGSGNYILSVSGNITAGSQLQIVRPPVDIVVHDGSTAEFTVDAIGTTPLEYQWQFNGADMPRATDPALTLNQVGAGDSGLYTVIVRDASGSTVSASAHLSVLDDGANGIQPVQVTAPSSPPPQVGKDNLLLITHGWSPFYVSGVLNFGDISWITNMANAISNKVGSGWEVRTFDWTGVSSLPFPRQVLWEGMIAGHIYGSSLARQHQWKNVHLIAHSAGAGVIEAIAASLRVALPNAVIQETFLDPYTGIALQERGTYGQHATWADNYFVIDFTDLFLPPVQFPLATSGPLSWAYNVDVSATLPSAKSIPVYFSGTTAGSTPSVFLNSHGSPIDFYMSTVTGAEPSCAAGYGFALSIEAEGAANWSNHQRNNRPYPLCASWSVPQNLHPVWLGGPVDFSSASYGVSSSGATLFGNSGMTLSSFSSVQPLEAGAVASNAPAWFAVGMMVTNPVNIIQFNAAFTDTNGAEGLLTVYWNTNQIGVIDERATLDQQTYQFALPGTVPEGLYTLSFRLDSFTRAISSITVTDVAPGFIGLSTAPVLSISQRNGIPTVGLSGETNYTYLLESSTNLVDWVPTALLVNTNDQVFYPDLSGTNSGARFFRGVIP